MQWLRWYQGTVEDTKMRLVARHAHVTVCHVVAVWALLLEDASKAEHRGICERDEDYIAAALDLEDGVAEAILTAMQSAGMISVGIGAITITHWKERQYETDAKDPTAVERQRRHREKTKRNAPVTIASRSENAASLPDTESDTDTDIEITPLPSEAPPSRTPKASRLPEGSMLPVEWASWAVGQGHRDPHAEWAKFHDYWIAKAGKDGAKQDWAATWRNWIRRTLESGGGARASPGRASTLARVMAAMQEPTQ